MKLSIAWIFEHISKDYKEINVPDLISKFSSTCAEIESTKFIDLDLSSFTIATVNKLGNNKAELFSQELKKEIVLQQIANIAVGQNYLIYKDKKIFRWATLQDLGSDKDGLVPSIWCHDKDLKGDWKKTFESSDYILEIDNKAVTNRPDLWGHRGFAREFAALLDAGLLPEERFFNSKPVKHYVHNAPVNSTNPFSLEIALDTSDCGSPCRRFAGLYIKSIENKKSDLCIATRLARIDSRPIDFIVDATNYVMFDIGQPMHAFDADTIKTKKIVARCASEDEKIELIDDSEVTLSNQDFVITDGQKPIALAGIMGGKDTQVTANTSSLFLESANFNASTIRKTALRLKKRTEASARFEKSLDPNQNTYAISRYLKILDDAEIAYNASDSIVSIGSLLEEKTIKVSHESIVDTIGVNVLPNKIQEILVKLGFGVQSEQAKDGLVFVVTVPTYRATKDITIPEDIIEEVARFVGYTNINMKMPKRSMEAFDISYTMATRAVKKHMAYGLGMNETQTYAFYDEEFLREIEFEPKDTLSVASPQSSNWQRLITSLVPNLVKCLSINKSRESLRFFESNRVWFTDNGQPVETLELAGIFYEQKKAADFYEFKALLGTLWDLLKINIEWVKAVQEIEPWYNENQVADLMHDGRIIGRAGKVSQKMLNRVVDGDAFVFELDANFLFNVKPEIHKFKPLKKYPEVHLDISILVDQDVVSADIKDIIKKCDPRIMAVAVIDFFEKEEWATKKSLTFSYSIYDDSKTMGKEDIDVIMSTVQNKLIKFGAEIR